MFTWEHSHIEAGSQSPSTGTKHHNSARGLSHRRARNRQFAVIVFTFDEGYVLKRPGDDVYW
jgi:hypothetical protein